LLKQTTEVKPHSFAMWHNFKTVAEPCLRRSVAGLSLQSLLFEHLSCHLAFVSQKIGTDARFFPGTFHTPVSILTLMIDTYTMTTVDAT